MDENDLEATALIDLTDDLHAAADSETNVVGGGCLFASLIALATGSGLIWVVIKLTDQT